MKKTILFILSLHILLALNISSARADLLQDSFAGMTTIVEPPGVLKSKTRISVSGGSFRSYASTATFQLFSFTPPGLSAGCGGISAHFGGLSFASGEEYKQLIEGIIQNSPGLLIHLAIVTACEYCSQAQQWIQKISDLARQSATDSCTAAKAVIGGIANATDMCKSMKGASATSGLIDDAAVDRCQSTVDSWDTWEFNLDNDENGQKQAESRTKCTDATYKVWCTLAQQEIIPVTEGVKDGSGLKIMIPIHTDSLSDTQMFERLVSEIAFSATIEKKQVSKESGETTVLKNLTSAPGHLIYKPYLCGRKSSIDTAIGLITDIGHQSTMSHMISKACGDYWLNTKELEISVMSDMSENENSTSTYKDPEFENVKFTDFLSDRKVPDIGLLYQILNLLIDTQDKKLTDEVKSLIMKSPVPLLKIINYEKAYPKIISELKLETGVIVTEMVLRRTILNSIRNVLSNSIDGAGDPGTAEKIKKTFESIQENIYDLAQEEREKNQIKLVTEELERLRRELNNEMTEKTLNSNLAFGTSYRQ